MEIRLGIEQSDIDDMQKIVDGTSDGFVVDLPSGNVVVFMAPGKGKPKIEKHEISFKGDKDDK